MRGVGRENCWTLVVRRIAMHAKAIAINRVESRIGIPSLVKMNAVDCRIQKFGNPLGVVAQSVVGGVRDHAVHGFIVG